MAKNRNCPNCGAPYDMQLNKCPYCGTSYFDMSTLDFNDREPFYLKVRYGDMTITQLVVPCFNDMSIDVSRDDTYLEAGDVMLAKYTANYNVKTNISFQAIADKDGSMMKFYKQV